jgi:ribosomal protein S18 acetylase RimI-like enzyme
MPLTMDLVKQASETGARAFADDPTTFYVIPNPKKRVNLKYAFEYYMRLSVLDRGECYVTSPRCEGTAIWAHSESKGSPFNVLRADWPWLPLKCGWTYLLRDALMERRYDRLREELAPRPHMYLGLLAIDPEYQGQGFASRLLRPVLARLDLEGLPAYLETQNLKNTAMYSHFGFKVIREDTTPGMGFTMYIMTRQPVSTFSTT